MYLVIIIFDCKYLKHFSIDHIVNNKNQHLFDIKSARGTSVSVSVWLVTFVCFWISSDIPPYSQYNINRGWWDTSVRRAMWWNVSTCKCSHCVKIKASLICLIVTEMKWIACCRHVVNTADIGDFCIEKLKGVGQGRKCVYCYTGELATQVSLMLGPLVCDTDPYLHVSHTHVNQTSVTLGNTV